MAKTTETKIFYADFLNGTVSVADLAKIESFSGLSNLLSYDQIDDMYPVSLHGYFNKGRVPSRIRNNIDDYDLPF